MTKCYSEQKVKPLPDTLVKHAVSSRKPKICFWIKSAENVVNILAYVGNIQKMFKNMGSLITTFNFMIMGLWRWLRD